MRQLLVLAAIAGLAVAKPETYREKEDFQYSRSSSDEGSKSGYYGAQRGNMGGNYERAHNMDPLAQNQMSGLVRTVEGELGDGAKQHTGSVYTAAKSTGVYGSGLYDLSNLEGRNFHEGTSYGDSHSHSSLASQHSSGYRNQHSASNTAGYSNGQILNAGFDSTRTHDGGFASTHSQNAAYNAFGNSHSRGSGYGRYNSGANSDQALYSSHQGSNLETASQYEDRNAASQNFGHYSQAAGYHGQVYDGSSNIHSRVYPSGTPVKIVIRPGTQVTVPVAAQTYDASQRSSTFDQNAINSDTEILNSNDHEISKPKVKNYESSYSYRKEWEKHDTKPTSGAGVMPLAIPTINPYPPNSELYEDAQASILQQQQRHSGISSQSHHSSHSGYNSASSNQYSTQQHAGSNSGIKAYQNAYSKGAIGANAGASSAYNHGASDSYIGATNGASGLNLVDVASTKPKSYQSSYSYHKSWERQGDPYVILPTTNGDYEQASGKLTAESLNQGAYGSHQSHSHQHSHQGYNSHSGDDCDEYGHIRKVRSTNKDKLEDFGHQTQNTLDLFGQQAQKQREELGQRTNDAWRQFGQQTQKQREELGQGTHDAWRQFGQQTQKQREELGQRTHDAWQQFGQQTQTKREKLEDFGHQTQNTWDLFDQQNQKPREGLGQEIHDTWQRLGQSQTQMSQLGDFNHQTQNTWDQLVQQTQKQEEELGQRTDNAHNGQERRHKWDELVDNGQQTLRKWGDQLNELGQQTQNQFSQIGQQIRETRSPNWDKLEDLGQRTQNAWGQFDQETQNQKSQLENLGQEAQNIGEQFGQQTETKWKWQNEGQQAQGQWDHDFEDLAQHPHSIWDKNGQPQRQNTWDKLEIEPQSPTDLGQQTQDPWTGQEIYSSGNNDRLTEQKPSAFDASSPHYLDMNFDHQSSDSKFDVINSNNNEKHVTQSHTLEKDSSNKIHHVHTIWDEIKKEEIGQENEDTVEDLSQTADLGQQSQVTWDSINQKKNRPGYQDTLGTAYRAHQDLTNSEPKNQDNTFVTPNPHPWMYNQMYHHHAHHNYSASSNQYLAHHSSSSSQAQFTWDNINEKENRPGYQDTLGKPYKPHHDLINSEPKNEDNTFVKPNPNPWMYNQLYHHRAHHNDSVHSNQYLGQHSSSFTQSHFTNMNADSDSQTHSSGSEFGSSITNLWDKLGNIEKHSIPSHESDQHKGIADIFGAQTQQNGNTDKAHTFKNQTSHDVFDRQAWPVQNNEVSMKPTTSAPNIEEMHKFIPADVERGDIAEVINENVPSDVGRGDIGPENSNELSKADQSKLHKTLEKIDSLSITKETDKASNTNVKQGENSEDDRDLKVMSLDEQRSAIDKSDSKVIITSTTQRSNHINHKPRNLGENQRNRQEQRQNKDQQVINNQFAFGQEIEQQQNTDQQAFNNQFAFGQETEQHQNTDQQAFSNQFAFGQDTQQQNTDQEIVDFGQQSESQASGSFQQAKTDLSQQNKQFDQVSLSSWKPDGSLSQNENKDTENLEQQSQTGWTVNTEDQQVQTVWQPNTENLQQQKQLTETFSQPMEDLSQPTQKIGHGVTFHQGNNRHKIEDLKQQNEQFGQVSGFKPDDQGSEDLVQQSQSGWTEIMEDQQVQTALRPEDLQQQSQLTHKYTSMQNLDQQVQTAWKPTEDLQQQSQLSDSVENLNQQVQSAWTEDLQQQNQHTNTFSQMEQNIPPTSDYKSVVSEELIVPKKAATVDTPQEVEVTEKPGFWKSIGNKFTNAKDKVSSWFSKS